MNFLGIAPEFPKYQSQIVFLNISLSLNPLEIRDMVLLTLFLALSGNLFRNSKVSSLRRILIRSTLYYCLSQAKL